MNKNNHNDDRDLSITDQPTGEYPLLVVDQTTGQSSAQGNGPIESVKAAYWLSHLESEITRLHAKWEGIDAEFKAREARIAELQNDVEAREGAINRVTAEVAARNGGAPRRPTSDSLTRTGEVATLDRGQRNATIGSPRLRQS